MAAREFAEIWGEQMHAARHLRVVTGVLAAVILLLVVALLRASWAPPPKPLVVRVDEVGRAEAVAYEVMEAAADPTDPTTGYFLHRFIVDHYGRRAGTVQEYWTRSLRFLSTGVANAAFASSSEEVAVVAAGLAGEELHVENVQVRILPQPAEPHQAAATFDLLRYRGSEMVERESWSVSMQFIFLTEIPAELVVWNPMGIVISFLQGDRIVTSAGSSQ
jgi:type IV secretory pathway TrbF-like protein